MVFCDFTGFRRACGIDGADGLRARCRLNADGDFACLKVEDDFGLCAAPICNGCAVDGLYFVAALEAGTGGNGVGFDCADVGAQFGYAERKTQAVQQNRQCEVGQRAGGDDGDAFGGMLFVEGAGQVGFGYAAFARVGHFDVAAQRNRGEAPFGLSVFFGEKRFAEADGKAQHFYAA